MSANFEDLRKALRVRLRAMPGYVGDAKVQWENRTFTPPETGLWMRENLVPGSERLTSTRFVECLGLYYLYVYGPVAQGTVEVHDYSRLVLDQFPPGTSIPGLGVHIFRSERLAPRMEGQGISDSANPTWFSVPVVIYWRMFASTPAAGA